MVLYAYVAEGFDLASLKKRGKTIGHFSDNIIICNGIQISTQPELLETTYSLAQKFCILESVLSPSKRLLQCCVGGIRKGSRRKKKKEENEEGRRWWKDGGSISSFRRS